MSDYTPSAAPAPAVPTTSLSTDAVAAKAQLETWMADPASPYWRGNEVYTADRLQAMYRDVVRGEAEGAADSVGPAHEVDADLPIEPKFYNLSTAHGARSMTAEDADIVDAFRIEAHKIGIGRVAVRRFGRLLPHDTGQGNHRDELSKLRHCPRLVRRRDHRRDRVAQGRGQAPRHNPVKGNSMTNAAVKDPPEPPKQAPPPPPAERARLVLVGHDVQHDLHLTICNEGEYEYLLDSPANYLRQADFKLLQPGTKFRTFADDETFYAELLVLSSRGQGAFVELVELFKTPLRPKLPAAPAAPGWVPEFRATHDRLVVLKDGNVRASGLSESEAKNRVTQEQANDALRARR